MSNEKIVPTLRLNSRNPNFWTLALPTSPERVSCSYLDDKCFFLEVLFLGPFIANKLYLLSIKEEFSEKGIRLGKRRI